MDYLMKFLSRQKNVPNKPFSKKIVKRIAVSSTEDLDNWVDMSIQDISRAMVTYHRTGAQADLEDALLSAEVLHAILDTLKTRAFG